MAGKQADIKVGVVTNYDDKGIKAAKVGMSSFKDSINDAEGVGKKFSAGWGNIKEQVSAHAGQLAVVAGAALVGFAAKAIGAFTDTAKSALDLSTSTGLAIEDASRWIGVGDDFQVGADALATGLGKIAKTMDDTKWAAYGVATRDAGGQARSTNDILLDTFDMLSKVDNKTEQARIGQQLFGKGYQSLTPILGHTREEYEKMLGSVEDGQVITEREAKTAEKMRLAQDQLGDAVHEVTLQIGQQLAGLSPLIVALAKFIELTGKAFGPGGITPDTGVLDTLYAMRAEADKGGKSWESYWAEVDDGKITLDEAVKQIHEAAAAAEALDGTLHDGEKSWETQTEWLDKVAEAASETDRETRKLTEGMKGGTAAFKDAHPPIEAAAGVLNTFAQSVAEADAAYRELTGDLSEEEAWENVVLAIDEFGKGTKATAQEVRDIKRDIAEYVAETATIPESKKTEIFAALRDGDIAEAERLLAELTRTRDIYLKLTGPGAVTAAGYAPSGTPHAAGGRVGAGEAWQLVGEKGPEAVKLPTGSQVHTAGATAAMMNGGGTTVNLTVNAGLGTDGYAVSKVIVNSLAEYDRRNGTHIVTPAGR